ncbi:MAG: pyridoxamine 5'-phosphate oxidase family protein, partial [Defluviitaleaceae bacterium]|nr:pyridoxamine 5'-phosphate oxidase family protein [Defluviitaleaceae bacterium]
KSGYVGGGMEGYAVLALLDENGYPTASTLTIAKADGINWLTFCTSPDSNKAMRVGTCNRASVCISTSEYNITLVGTAEIITDEASKKASWLPQMANTWSGPHDPSFCVLRFNTQRYNIYFADNDAHTTGTLSPPQKEKKLSIAPILSFNGQCNQAMKLYEEAFGAITVTKIHYSEASPNDLQYKQEEKDFIYYAEMAIGDHLISMGDDSAGKLQNVDAKANTLSIALLVQFETLEELEATYKLMANGATIITPLGSSTYCTGAVSFVDQYGIYWDFMSGYSG